MTQWWRPLHSGKYDTAPFSVRHEIVVLDFEKQILIQREDGIEPRKEMLHGKTPTDRRRAVASPTLPAVGQSHRFCRLFAGSEIVPLSVNVLILQDSYGPSPPTTAFRTSCIFKLFSRETHLRQSLFSF